MSRLKRPSIDNVALAREAAAAGDLTKAERMYRDAIRDRDEYAYNNLAQLLIEGGRLGEGEALFHEGVAAGDGLAAKNLALTCSRKGGRSRHARHSNEPEKWVTHRARTT